MHYLEFAVGYPLDDGDLALAHELVIAHLPARTAMQRKDEYKFS